MSLAVLISGGLDSMLAAKVIVEQGIHVEGINFYTGFCVEGHTHAIRRAALTALKETAGTPTEVPAKAEVALIRQWQEWFQQRPARTPASSDRQSHRPRKSTPQS